MQGRASVISLISDNVALQIMALTPKCVSDESSVQRQQSVLCPVYAGESGQMTCEHNSIIQLKGSCRSPKPPQLETKITFIPQNQVLSSTDGETTNQTMHSEHLEKNFL